MSFSTGVFSKFSSSTSVNSIIAFKDNPIFAPPSASIFSNVYSLVAAQTISPSGGTVTNATSLRVDSPTGAVNNYSMLLTGTAPAGFGGTPTNSYILIGATVSSLSISRMFKNFGVFTSATTTALIGNSEQTGFNPPLNTTYGSATALQIAGTRGGSGTVSNLTNLMVDQPTGGPSGTVSNVCAEFKGITYHEAGLTFGAPGIAGYGGTAASADILKYYIENNSWLPTVAGSTAAGTPVYLRQMGYYHRIGAVLFLEAFIEWATNTGATGNQLIASLPFAPRNLSNYYPVAIPSISNINGAGGFSYAALQFYPSSVSAILMSVRSNNATIPIIVDTNGGTISFNGFYLI